MQLGPTEQAQESGQLAGEHPSVCQSVWDWAQGSGQSTLLSGEWSLGPSDLLLMACPQAGQLGKCLCKPTVGRKIN